MLYSQYSASQKSFLGDQPGLDSLWVGSVGDESGAWQGTCLQPSSLIPYTAAAVIVRFLAVIADFFLA